MKSLKMKTLKGLAAGLIVGMAAWGMTGNAAHATLIPFTVQFGADGSGNFIYDDDSANAGANQGFTFFSLDFSPAAGAAFSSIGLSASGISMFGPGGTSAAAAFATLTEPFSTNSIVIESSDTTVPLFGLLLITGGNFAGNIARVDPNTGCTIGNFSAPGQYAFCTRDAGGFTTGSGSFTNSLTAVPAPATGLLLVTGLAGLGWVNRRRTKV